MIKITNNLFSVILFLLLPTSFCCCSDEEAPAQEPSFIKVEKNILEFDYFSDVKTLSVSTNLDNISCSVSSGDWCTAVFSDNKLTVTITSANMDKSSRATTIVLKSGNIKQSVTIKQAGRNPKTSDLKDDIKISVKSGTASSAQSGEGIEKSFDGDLKTLYHSKWDNSSPGYFPITLTYNFENVSSLDYLIYYPRISGTNGNIKKFKLYVATENNNTLTEYGSYDFGGRSSAGRISFVPALQKPVKIQFVVESGIGDSGPGFVSCAEMEFYKKNTENFDYLTVFTDHTCSQLKPGISLQDIESLPDFYKGLAFEIYKGLYDTEFRVQNYKSWKDPSVLATQNKTGTLGMRDNPTGICVAAGEEIVLFAGDTHRQAISLFIQDLNNNISGTSYSLSTGLNKFKSATTGLIYIMYYTQAGTEPPVKINIVNGTVNGYFDSQKHKKEDWKRLLDKATFKHFDVIGKYASLTFETEAFRTYTPDGIALMDKYDDLVRLEQDFMGLYKYGREFKNKPYFLVVYGDNYMYSTGSYTGYNNSTQKDILNVNKLSTSDCWGPAHELGHSLQTRPGLKWAGMTEVTNNLLSLHVQTSWKNTSRLITDNRYQKAKNSLLNKNIPYNKSGNDVFEKLVPLWQLKLYLQDALGKKDFYKDLHEAIRKQENINVSVLTESYYQLEFVKIACDIAELDLTDFFEAWGFLTVTDEKIEDYGSYNFKITPEQIDQVKKYIAGRNYKKPKHPNVYDITDENVSEFQ